MELKLILFLIISYTYNLYYIYRLYKNFNKILKIIIQLKIVSFYIIKILKNKIQKIHQKFKNKNIKLIFKSFLFFSLAFFFSDIESLCESPLVSKFFTQEEIEEILNMNLTDDERKELIKERIDEKIKLKQEDELLNLLLYFGITCILIGLYLWFFGGDGGDDDYSSSDDEESYYPGYQRGNPSKLQPWLTEYQQKFFGKRIIKDRTNPFCVVNFLYFHDMMEDLDLVDKINQEIDDWEERNIYNKSKYNKKN